MLVFNSEMHLFTFVFVVLELMMLAIQLFYYYSRPQDKRRLWFLWLLVLLVFYNVTGGLFPDPNFGMSVIFQNVLAYGAGFLMASYFPWFFYKAFKMKQLRFHAVQGVWWFLVLPYFFFFGVVYIRDGNLDFAIKYGLVVPFGYALVLLYAILKAIGRKFAWRRESGYPAGRWEVLAMYAAVLPWVFLIVLTYLHMPQWIEVLVTNAGFVLVTIALMKRWVAEARREHAQHRRLMVLDFNFSASGENYQLTEREKEVAVLFCRGMTYKAVAAKLFISEKTVNTHLQNTYAKTGVKNRIELLQKLGFGDDPSQCSFYLLSYIKSMPMKQDDLNLLIDRLLDTLNSMVPILPSFRFQLRPLMHYQVCQHKQELLLPPGYALFAWFILAGLVIATEVDEQGTEQVVRIYSAGEIFSDLKSFLEGKPSTVRLTVIGESEMLYIRRSDYKNVMEPLSDTHKLVRCMQFREQAIERERTQLMSMSNEDKFEKFAASYPMDQVPNVVGASFLKMTEPRYCAAKSAYNIKVLKQGRNDV